MVERAYDFLMPSVNFFGPGVISKIGERAKMLGMKKPVIVTDKFLENLKNGAVAQTLASLKKSGFDYVVYNEVEPNPKIHNIKEVKTLYEKRTLIQLLRLVVDQPMIPEKVPASL